MTQYTEGGSVQDKPSHPFLDAPSSWEGSIDGANQNWPRSTSKKHGISVIHLSQSYCTHRLKICFVLMSSISTLEQPSATSHCADATRAGHRSFSSDIPRHGNPCCDH